MDRKVLIILLAPLPSWTLKCFTDTADRTCPGHTEGGGDTPASIFCLCGSSPTGCCADPLQHVGLDGTSARWVWFLALSLSTALAGFACIYSALQDKRVLAGGEGQREVLPASNGQDEKEEGEGTKETTSREGQPEAKSEEKTEEPEQTEDISQVKSDGRDEEENADNFVVVHAENERNGD